MDILSVVIDAENGEVNEIVTTLTSEEVAEIEQIESDYAANLQAKAEARESALAKLAALGLTQEEIEAL